MSGRENPMYSKFCRLIAVAIAVLIGLSHASSNKTIPFNKLRNEAMKKAGNKGYQITDLKKLVPDADWVGMGQAEGVVGSIYALVADQKGNIYAGGNFTRAGGISANNIAKWDGTSWSALGSGVTNGAYEAYVHVCAVDSSGNLYVGGKFNTAGSVAAWNLARWDGSAWSAVGNHAKGFYWVMALAPDNKGNLYVGGEFDSAGPLPANNIAKWDGNTWSALGNGVRIKETREECYAIITLAFDDSGQLYAGGWFDTAGSVVAHNVAKWDGKEWSGLGNGLDDNVCNLVFDRTGGLYASGWFDTAGSAAAYHLAKWDNGVWSALGDSVGDYWDNMAISVDTAGIVYAGNGFHAVGTGTTFVFSMSKWDGSAWKSMGNGFFGDVNECAIDQSGTLYAAGSFFREGDSPLSNIARWRDKKWSPVCQETGKGFNGSVSAFAVDGNGKVFAGGNFTAIGMQSAPLIAQWDNGGWSKLGNGIQGRTENFGGVHTVTIDKKKNIYAGGNFNTADSIVVNNIAKWDGSTWSALGSGIRNKQYGGCVYDCVFDHEGNLYAAGSFDSSGGVAVSSIAKWDGSTWSALGSGIRNKQYGGCVYDCVFDHEGNLYAAGSFDSAGGVAASNIAKWDGSTWSALGSGVSGSVQSVAIDSFGNLYAGGQFTSAGGAAVNYIAKWGGGTWNALGSGTGGPVWSVAIDSFGNLYAGGQFTGAGEAIANNIAKWNGSVWSALGSGVEEGPVTALCLDGKGNLFVGGGFTTAGGKASSCFAIYRLNNTGTAPSKQEASDRTLFSYETGKGTIRVHLKTEMTVHVRLYSLSGREVYSTSERMSEGTHTFKIRSPGLARGAYIAQVKAGSESMRWKIVVRAGCFLPQKDYP
jgi:hypothetical protein